MWLNCLSLHHMADCGLHGLNVRVQLDCEVRRACAIHIAESISLDLLNGSLLAKRIMKTDLTVVAHHYDKRGVKLLVNTLLVMQVHGLLRLESYWHETTRAVWLTVLCSYARLLLHGNWRLHRRRTWFILSHWRLSVCLTGL